MRPIVLVVVLGMLRFGALALVEAYNVSEASARMMAEMRAGVAGVNGTAIEAVRSAFTQTQKKHAVWIVRGKILVDRKFLGSTKAELHLRMMRSILKTTHNQVPKLSRLDWSFVYSFDEAASGPGRCALPPLPTFVIAKKFHGQCGHLIPNPYFGDLNDEWAHETGWETGDFFSPFEARIPVLVSRSVFTRFDSFLDERPSLVEFSKSGHFPWHISSLNSTVEVVLNPPFPT